MKFTSINNAGVRSNFFAGAALSAMLVAGLAPTSALAQAAQSAEEDQATSADQKDIVVTGTLLRGIAPVGSNTISVSQATIESVAPVSGNALLATLPQITNYFNNVPVSDLAIAVNQIQISRPNIRNLSGNNAASSATLVLVDGHRLASVGVNQASIDPDLIPIGAIERVEVVADGGSSTYGADAVAGVINFITIKRFDGIKVGGHYGIADNYYEWDANATIGKEWENGSIFASYSYSKNDRIFGRDRDFIRNVNYGALPYVGQDLACAAPNLAVNTIFTPANFTISSVNYAAPGFAANTTNRCDNSEDASRVPSAERHGALVGLNYSFGDSTTLDARAYYGRRETSALSTLTAAAAINGNNPFAASALPAGVVLSEGVVATRASVNFSFAPLLGVSTARANTTLEEYGARAEITQDFGENFQVRALANFSRSDSSYFLERPNQARLNAASAPSSNVGRTAANTFNPLNVGSNNAALVADILDNVIAGQTKDEIVQLRLIGEGKLFELPAGDVRVAAGYEYVHDKLERRFQSDIRVGALGTFPLVPYTRNVNSVFGEIVAPIIARGDGGAMLTLSASGRYDKYSDFGSTTNPKFGFTFEPVKNFKIRGSYGTSFTAPTPVDQLGSLANTLSSFPFVPFVPAGGPAPLSGANNTIAFQGSRANLGPQSADTYSLGFDATPTRGLNISATYYQVKFSDTLRTPTANAGIFVDFPNNVLYNVNGLTNDQITTFLGASPQLTNLLTGLAGGRVTEVVDFRVGNFGIIEVKGIDASLNINHETGFGSIDLGVNANIELNRDLQASSTSLPTAPLNKEAPSLRLRATTGITAGGFRGQFTWNHTSGFDIVATASTPVQNSVAGYSTFDAFFKYDVRGEGVFKDLSFTLNVNNIFDKNPPVLFRNNPNEFGYANGFTLGRLFKIGISKKF